MSIVDHVLTRARAQNLRLAVAESCTGGMLGAALTAVAGSSDVFECGFVTYSNEAKMRMLGVSETSLHDHGAVSEEVACEMATGAMENAKVDLAVSITGIAGPGGSENKPEGRVCFGLARTGSETTSHTCEFGVLGREKLREQARDHAVQMLADALD